MTEQELKEILDKDAKAYLSKEQIDDIVNSMTVLPSYEYSTAISNEKVSGYEWFDFNVSDFAKMSTNSDVELLDYDRDDIVDTLETELKKVMNDKTFYFPSYINDRFDCAFVMRDDGTAFNIPLVYDRESKEYISLDSLTDKLDDIFNKLSAYLEYEIGDNEYTDVEIEYNVIDVVYEDYDSAKRELDTVADYGNKYATPESIENAKKIADEIRELHNKDMKNEKNKNKEKTERI